MDALNHAKHIVTRLKKQGYQAYFAGGWVRDYCMQHPSADIDIATDAPPEKILDLFPHTILVGLAFAVVIVVIEGHQFEISTFRKDLHYENGRKPVGIELCGPEEDALRRDFTINGMFYDPLEERIIDYVGGQEDIKRGVIKAIGDPYKRFDEDRLRMMRAIRFASRFNFHIDLETEEGIIANASSLFPAVAMERIFQEFNKIAAHPHIDRALIEMHRLQLLAVIFPSLETIHLNDLKKRVSSYAYFPYKTPTILYLMELFADASLEEQLAICQMLRSSKEEERLVEMVDRIRKMEEESDLFQWAKVYAHPRSQLFIEVVAARLKPDRRLAYLQNRAAQQSALASHIERLQNKQPLLTSHYLLTQGFLPGKEMGRVLKEGERLAITNNLQTVEDVMQHLKRERFL